MRGLAGRLAAVTGGSGGIGRAVVQRLQEEGVAVVVLDLQQPPASADPGVRFIAVDVSDPAAVTEALGREAVRPDFLVNVAGIFDWEDWSRGIQAWDGAIRVDLGGVAACCRAVLPGMCERGFGRVVTISSNAAVVGFRNMPSYGAAKAGILGLTISLAADVGRRNVTVNAVCPGSIATGMGECERLDKRRSPAPLGRGPDAAAAGRQPRGRGRGSRLPPVRRRKLDHGTGARRRRRIQYQRRPRPCRLRSASRRGLDVTVNPPVVPERPPLALLRSDRGRRRERLHALQPHVHADFLRPRPARRVHGSHDRRHPLGCRRGAPDGSHRPGRRAVSPTTWRPAT